MPRTQQCGHCSALCCAATCDIALPYVDTVPPRGTQMCCCQCYGLRVLLCASVRVPMRHHWRVTVVPLWLSPLLLPCLQLRRPRPSRVRCGGRLLPGCVAGAPRSHVRSHLRGETQPPGSRLHPLVHCAGSVLFAGHPLCQHHNCRTFLSDSNIQHGIRCLHQPIFNMLLLSAAITFAVCCCEDKRRELPPAAFPTACGDAVLALLRALHPSQGPRALPLPSLWPSLLPLSLCPSLEVVHAAAIITAHRGVEVDGARIGAAAGHRQLHLLGIAA